ncbi:hypothetical protein DXG01_017089 [Tephrocybe rancida]|nr:hypothetical protein DXG01_017089 [Tephrocybe rancida]
MIMAWASTPGTHPHALPSRSTPERKDAGSKSFEKLVVAHHNHQPIINKPQDDVIDEKDRVSLSSSTNQGYHEDSELHIKLSFQVLGKQKQIEEDISELDTEKDFDNDKSKHEGRLLGEAVKRACQTRTHVEVDLLVDRTLDSLANLSSRYDSSTAGKPSEWLNTINGNLLHYIAYSQSDRTMKKQCTDWVSRSIPFPHLAVYLYCTKGDLAALRAVIAVCEGRDTLKTLCRFKEIKDWLRRSFSRDTAGPGGDYHDAGIVKKIFTLDDDVVCSLFYGLVENAEQYSRLVLLQGSEAQALLDLVQTLLDLPSLDRIFRSPFLHAMIRLSRQSKLFPESLWQEQVSIDGNEAINAGSFGDIWKGVYRGQEVAIKVLRLYQKSDLDDHKKVADVAEGLNYLHTLGPKIIHGDLKAVNILISDAYRACIADFGLSTLSESQVIQLEMFSPFVSGGTASWTAPELLKATEKTANTKTDAYSFAVVCFEIFSCDVPFPDLHPYPIMLQVIEGQRPARPAQCKHWKTPCVELGLNDKLWGLIERCWDADPERRPSMSTVLQELPSMQHDTPAAAVDYQHFELSSGGLWDDLITT